MRAMILAAGRGERMRPLTDHTPKPLLTVGGKPLIVWHLERLARAGLRDVVVNNAWLGDQLMAALGTGERWGVRITHSPEGRALETAGGIAQALPHLGPTPFLVINGDLWCDWPLERAHTLGERLLALDALCACVMIENPPHHPAGDFLLEGGRLHADRETGVRLTFSGIGVYHPKLFGALPAGHAAPLAPLLRSAMQSGQALGERHDGVWQDIGTVARLQALQAQFPAGA
jgi:MurNAc alpha-1-phosphate uridylyltransferase